MSDFYEIDFLGVETKKSGDAIALRYRVGEATKIHVVDGGYQSTGERLRDHLIRYYDNPQYIDNVVATHNDSDHACGLVPILEHFRVGALWMLRPWEYAAELLPHFTTYKSVDRLRAELRSQYNNLAALEEIALRKRVPIVEPFQGARIGAFTVLAPSRLRFLTLVLTSTKTPQTSLEGHGVRSALSILMDRARSAVSNIAASWGAEAFPADNTSNENEMSVVQYAGIAGRKLLLTADTGREGLQEAIDYAPYAGLQLPGLDFVQVPHHGGRHNATSELLDALIGPRLSHPPVQGTFTAYVSSALEDEDHPRKVVVRAFMHRGATLYATEGRDLRHFSPNSPARAWGALAPASYPAEYESV